jgi:hypothetical protein
MRLSTALNKYINVDNLKISSGEDFVKKFFGWASLKWSTGFETVITLKSSLNKHGRD